MNVKKLAGKGWAKAILLALILLLFVGLFSPFMGGRYAMKTAKADASYGDSPCKVHYYKVTATVGEDRTIAFEEEISFTLSPSFPTSDDTFYRALPIEGDRYLHIEAEGVGNPDFSYYVADNPDEDGFIDINCTGGVKANATLTYRFRYTMEIHSSNTEEGMIIDFVGAGWPFALNNVDVIIRFPAPIAGYEIHSTRFGEAGNDYVTVLNQTENQLYLHADELPLSHSSYEYTRFAVPITVDFRLESGGLAAMGALRTSPTAWIPWTLGVVFLLVAVGLLLSSLKKPILSTVVGFTAPNGIDPMELGLLLDGTVDEEDVSSMIYYFASKGYLTISMEGGSPVLKRVCSQLPDTETPHASAVFDGLFPRGREQTCVDDLTQRFYQHAEQAKALVEGKRQRMYTGGSVARFVGCGLLSAGLFFFAPMLAGLLYVGGGYVSAVPLIMLFPVLTCLILWLLLENYRYKWGAKKRFWISFLAVGILLIGAVLSCFTSTHLLTMAERIITLVFGTAILLISAKLLVRRTEYMETLGKLLGFKEFILVTKKDRLEAMLETSPELFYDVLPYAQVMGVSDVWEKKFKSITMQPPRWYAGDFSLFDFWVLNSAMRSMRYSMMMRPKSGGKSVGGIGGGGYFGGFSGGGGGGGGGGFR